MAAVKLDKQLSQCFLAFVPAMLLPLACKGIDFINEDNCR
ncbi:Uncharacterised protein [Mycobacteroides abscessus subsp. abscessus]|nr:Uncharacterised protein [Mycobacteroides abscessus subsp. abscessus]